MIQTRTLLAWLLLVVVSVLAPAGCRSGGPDDMVTRRHKTQRKAAVLSDGIFGRPEHPQSESLVFTSFRDDGEFGLYLATSRDGYVWTNVSEKPILVPRVGPSQGLRDPHVSQGPDGVYHMVWTLVGPMPRSIGYARSTDLIEWTDIRELKVVPDAWPVDWTWAPALFYDQPAGEWIISWSAAVKGQNPQTQAHAEHNHRLHFNTTRDFRALSPAQEYFDPGYPVIDPAYLERDGGVVMFFKDERQWGPAGEKKQIKWVGGPGPRGPWGEPSTAITMRWCEGPSPLVLGEDVIVYFDEYTRGGYGAVRSRDMRTWDDISRKMSFPEGHRHGSVLRVPEGVLARLEALRERGGVQ